MPVFITSLNSGSNGNCYYVGNENEAVLIDAGLSCRETEKRMKRLELSMEKVKAIFVSHEHSDHVTGLPSLSKKYRLPVYITPNTFTNSRLPIEEELVFSFSAYQPVKICNLTVTAFPKCHDACDPHSFIVTCGDIKTGILTDIGYPCSDVIKHFKECHAVILEANYDDDMLMKGNYPYHLKKRISGNNGHLSNKQALDLFLQHGNKRMSHLILSHLSKNNNCPNLVQQLFQQHAGNTHISVASRYVETPVYTVSAGAAIPIGALKKAGKVQAQLSLF